MTNSQPLISSKANVLHCFTYDCCTNKALLTPHLKERNMNVSHANTTNDKRACTHTRIGMDKLRRTSGHLADPFVFGVTGSGSESVG